MTTDITELAQREKFEAWFKSSFHPDKTGPYIKDQLYFAWKAASAELVEALESKERTIQVLESSYNEQTEAPEKAQQTEKTLESRNRRLDGIITAAEKRIAELEARTVRLPKERSATEFLFPVAVYPAQELTVALTAQGIKVEAE
ncbi:TPA: hypothetical protein MJF06_005645 [Klebsiella pneumoniae]|nr:hypothetical protein [Klebsiella pneumoniae]HBY9921776.1 hypothetical protein [Klebsiella pneumoniae]